MAMNWVDYLLVGIIILSALVSLIRGFVREFISLLSWIIAIWAALTYCHAFAASMPEMISNETARISIAFAILFLGILLCGALIGYLVAHLVEKTRLTLMNRLLGVVFGLARGALVIAIAILICELTPAPQYNAYKQSVLIPKFTPITTWIHGFLPDYVNKHFPSQVQNVQDGVNQAQGAVTN